MYNKIFETIIIIISEFHMYKNKGTAFVNTAENASFKFKQPFCHLCTVFQSKTNTATILQTKLFVIFFIRNSIKTITWIQNKKN